MTYKLLQLKDMNGLAPLIVNGKKLRTPAHKFAIVWPKGKVMDFPTWVDLRTHIRHEIRAENCDAFKCKFYVFLKEWLEVPRPEF